VNALKESEGSLGADASTLAVALALEVPWLPTLSERSSR
jgi:hypothetical protein